jgi:translation initiation factor 2B subunit (eIF-2B alpha/beta/delta family)
MANSYLKKKREFNKIIKDIQSVKIQGARNIASFALKAYFLFPSEKSKSKLLSLRPTEPMLHKVLDLAEKISLKEILQHFDESQNQINKKVFGLIRNHSKIFTHCHSTNVINALIYAKKKGKKFEVYNTETRPLFQGRKTSKDLSNSGIKVTQFVDSAIALAIEKQNKKDKEYVNLILIGADAITNKGIINKIGSGIIGELAYVHKIPLYVVADSWKFTKNKIPIEQRSLNEVWDKAPKKIKIENPAFEFVPKKYITKIVTELGILKFDDFVRKMK